MNYISKFVVVSYFAFFNSIFSRAQKRAVLLLSKILKSVSLEQSILIVWTELQLTKLAQGKTLESCAIGSFNTQSKFISTPTDSPVSLILTLLVTNLTLSKILFHPLDLNLLILTLFNGQNHLSVFGRLIFYQ